MELKQKFNLHLEPPLSPRFFERCLNEDILYNEDIIFNATAFRIVFQAISVGVKEHCNQALLNIKQFVFTPIKLTNNLRDGD